MGMPTPEGSSWTAPCGDLAEARHADGIGTTSERDDQLGRLCHVGGEPARIERDGVLRARAQGRAVPLGEVDLTAELHRRPRRIDHDLEDVAAADHPCRPALLDRDRASPDQVYG